ncbi:riboflavin biosynthesis protein [Halobacillus andaensis]|uniref:FAD synthase n=1 Tax=Halobacillus andaensis TaxID=1176239 RepID=A0A917ETL8_HALAA|nr:FAD synthetase family protein [Halobacillus andaensis]MBP2003892.1 riboflavin kinase/FMN adenylyltransferase [Halobacillus andaensis]GGF14052.1 riboflavin biosynthesis protein [Halobacillus andaensis]
MEQIHIDFPIRSEIQGASEPCVMALGFFDGVHLGHQEIIKRAKAIADRKKLKLAVMTFFPHPSSVIPKGPKVTHYLTPLPVKAEIFEQLGVDLMYVVEFNEQVAKIPHDQFTDAYLCGLNVQHAVAGFDYKYGFKGKGTMEQLTLDSRGRFAVTTVSKLEKHEQKVGSTLLRELISTGRVEKVNDYLGKEYEMVGQMNGYGKTIEVKIDPAYFLPCSGSYEVTVSYQGFRAKGVCEISSQAANDQLKIRLFHESLLGHDEPVVVAWNNFIADFEMHDFHAQANMLDVRL